MEQGCLFPLSASPIGDEEPYQFCGKPRQPGSSYCPEHHAVCYRPCHQAPIMQHSYDFPSMPKMN
jgi:hypothetical protein